MSNDLVPHTNNVSYLQCTAAEARAAESESELDAAAGQIEAIRHQMQLHNSKA
jgi:hypothetical protein